MRTVIEGPDKTGKSTLTMAMAEEDGVEHHHLPDGMYREKLLSGEFTGTTATFLFFTNTMAFWESQQAQQEDFYMDRDILSMIVYQGMLLKTMDPMIILNLFKSVVYKHNRPDKIIYLVNDPFEEYTKGDKFEKFGYSMIRAAYDKAYRLCELNFPEIEFSKLYVEGV